MRERLRQPLLVGLFVWHPSTSCVDVSPSGTVSGSFCVVFEVVASSATPSRAGAKRTRFVGSCAAASLAFCVGCDTLVALCCIMAALGRWYVSAIPWNA